MQAVAMCCPRLYGVLWVLQSYRSCSGEAPPRLNMDKGVLPHVRNRIPCPRAFALYEVHWQSAQLAGQRRAKRTTERIAAELRGEEADGDAAR
jgi:hypothetical protein